MVEHVHGCIVLLFKERERNENRRVVEKRSSLQSRVPDSQNYSAGESSETLILFWNELREQAIQDILGPHRNLNDESCAEGAIMPIA